MMSILTSSRGPRRLALTCALALAIVGAAGPGSDADHMFVTALLAAMNSRTVAARAALVHPRSRPCITGEVGEWWIESVTRQAAVPVPADHTWEITPLSAEDARAAADRFDWPITPTHVLQLQMRDSPTTSRTMLVRLAKNGERWAEVVPCAKPETVTAIRAARAEAAKRVERVKALAAGTSVDLRNRVIALYRGGHRIDACQTYGRESGEELAVARDVVDLLAAGSR